MKLSTVIFVLFIVITGCEKENSTQSRQYGFDLVYKVGSGWVKWNYTARFDSLCNIFIQEKREHPYILNSQRNFRVSGAELANLVLLTKQLSDLNLTYEYDEIGDTTTFDLPVASMKYMYLDKQDSVIFLDLKTKSFQLDTLINYTLHLLKKYDPKE